MNELVSYVNHDSMNDGIMEKKRGKNKAKEICIYMTNNKMNACVF